MMRGQPVEVQVLAYPGRIFEGKLNFVAPSVEPTTHRLPVQAEVENPDSALKPEMFANFSIITGDEETRRRCRRMRSSMRATPPASGSRAATNRGAAAGPHRSGQRRHGRGHRLAEPGDMS